jgi:hypothetical protein
MFEFFFIVFPLIDHKEVGVELRRSLQNRLLAVGFLVQDFVGEKEFF